MARRSRGGSRRAGRVRYSWHGFYQPTAVSLDVLVPKIFVLYDPRDADHQEEVVHERCIGRLNIQNVATAGFAVGWGVYVVERDAAVPPNVPNVPDVLGFNAHEIESNWTLWHGSLDVPGTPTGVRRVVHSFDINIKARRKVQDPRMVVFIIEPTVIDRGLFDFHIRTLVREGRF